MFRYEWDVETIEEDDEVIDHDFKNTFEECRQYLNNTSYDVVLVCTDDNTESRSWAYLVDNKLLEYFEDASFNEVRKIPQRFHKKVNNS